MYLALAWALACYQEVRILLVCTQYTTGRLDLRCLVCQGLQALRRLATSSRWALEPLLLLQPPQQPATATCTAASAAATSYTAWSSSCSSKQQRVLGAMMTKVMQLASACLETA
jgi:hypothetical protein